MPLEFSAGAVIFRREKNKILYLILKYEAGHWDFVKGHIGDKIKGEKAKETVIRESEEEAGLTDLRFVEDFKHEIHYFLRKEGKTYFKTVTFFLAETKQKKIKLSSEHVGYKWLGFEDALEQITYDNAKKVLKRANDFLKKVER